MNTELIHSHEEAKEREKNRREYPRIPYIESLWYTICIPDKADALYEGFSLNISQGGVLFTTQHIPPLSSIIVLETDLDTLSKCIEIEYLLFRIQDYLFGKVVRVINQTEKNYFVIGISFIKQSERKREDIQEAIALITKV